MRSWFPTRIDVEELLKEALALPYSSDGSGAEMAFVQSGGIPAISHHLFAAIQEIAQARELTALNLMINKLPPNVVVPKHRDWIKPTPLQPKEQATIERWHLPIKTNANAYWWDEENGYLTMLQGIWYGPMPYWKHHFVGNLGTEVRVQLIVDLDTPIPIGTYD